jgi:ferredoxin
MASTDPVAMDTVMAEMMGFDPESLDLLKAASRLGAGVFDSTQIELLGDEHKAPDMAFKLPGTAQAARRMPRWIVPLAIGILKSQPEINRAKCRKCNMCKDSCPVHAIDAGINIDRKKCITCMCCHELCPFNAIDLKRVNPVAQLLIPAGKSFGGGH